MIIHVIGTINGQANEGMRNIATHLAHEFENDNVVLYSGLKQLPRIIGNSKKSDVTIICARANKLVYGMAKLVSIFCKNVWLLLVQKPDKDFQERQSRKPLKINFLAISEKDLLGLTVAKNNKCEIISVGIKTEKFVPVTKERQSELKQKYGFASEEPLVIHVGHCSKGRGLEDFTAIHNAQRLVISSGMFEDINVVNTLEKAGVTIKKGYIENVEEIYQMADVYLFPTKSTEYVISIPLSVMEALSCGVPVIGYDSFDNLKDIHGTTGAITFVNSSDEINACLSGVAQKKSEKSLLMNVYSWNEVANQVLKIVWR